MDLGLMAATWRTLAALIDMHTRKVVGWAMRETLHAVVHRADEAAARSYGLSRVM